MQQIDYFLPGESCLNAEHGSLTGTQLANGADKHTNLSCLKIAQTATGTEHRAQNPVETSNGALIQLDRKCQYM